jgi:gluconate 2-dehydrogenase gamma chain
MGGVDNQVRLCQIRRMSDSNKIDRRTLIHNLVRGGLALSLLPGFAEAAWAAIAQGIPAPRVLGGAQNGMISLIADAILPRSDTPSATDVGVPPWIDLIVADYFSGAQRESFLAGLAAIDDFALSSAGARIDGLKDGALTGVILSLDAACGAKDPNAAQHGYAQLKELIIVGYFTSKPVQQDILKVVIVPGRFDANVLVAPLVATQ